MGASTEVVSNPRLSRPASGESLTRHRARPRVGHRLTGCSTVAVKRGSTALPYLTFYLQNSTFWRTDERTRTADLISLRVITQALQGVAEACKFRISIGVSFLRVAACCTVLRSRWYQSGIKGLADYRSPVSCAWQESKYGNNGLPATGSVHARRYTLGSVRLCLLCRHASTHSLRSSVRHPSQSATGPLCPEPVSHVLGLQIVDMPVVCLPL